jgi:hypothetical protein
MKSRKMKWRGHVPCTEEKRNAFKMLIRKTDGKRLFRKTTGGKIILEWGLEKYVVRMWTGFI